MTDQSPASRVVEVVCDDGVSLYVRKDRVGAGAPTYVFVHGVASSSQEFREQLEAFRGHVNMVFYDQRGHGKSACGDPGRISVSRLAQDLNHVIEKTTAQDERIVLVTHSLGGMVGLALVGQAPELLGPKIAGIALISTAATRIPEVAAPSPVARILVRSRAAHGLLQFLALCAPALDALKLPETLPGRWYLRYTMFGRSSPTETLLRAKQALWAHTSAAVIASAYRSLLTYDRTESLELLRRVPVLVVSGTTDRTIPVRRSELLTRRIGATAELVVVPDAGHSVNQTHPAVVNDALRHLSNRAMRAMQ
ncbi:alpha/beta fold hydrolase [Arthrobacter sp. TMS2-4]